MSQFDGDHTRRRADSTSSAVSLRTRSERVPTSFVATPCRHTFSGAVVACLVAAMAGIGSVQAAAVSDWVTNAAFVAPDACPPSWPALRLGPHSDTFDGNVSVLVGGNLRVGGAAAGAEGTVVALGDATLARDVPGSYQVGATALGSQVTPFAGSDMLVVGGNLTGDPAPTSTWARGSAATSSVGGARADGTDIDAHGGERRPGVAARPRRTSTWPASSRAKSAAYAALPATGTVEVERRRHHPDRRRVGRAGLRRRRRHPRAADGPARPLAAARSACRRARPWSSTSPARPSTSTWTALLSPDGSVVDPLADPYFADLATHLLWNAPTATTVDIGGLAQLPGSRAGPEPPQHHHAHRPRHQRPGPGRRATSCTPASASCTPTRSCRTRELGCAAEPVHLATLTLDVELQDPDHVVDQDRYFEGRFQCSIGGVDVTPRTTPGGCAPAPAPRVLSDQIPSGATCTVTERLDAPPGAVPCVVGAVGRSRTSSWWRSAEPRLHHHEQGARPAAAHADGGP